MITISGLDTHLFSKSSQVCLPYIDKRSDDLQISIAVNKRSNVSWSLLCKGTSTLYMSCMLNLPHTAGLGLKMQNMKTKRHSFDLHNTGYTEFDVVISEFLQNFHLKFKNSHHFDYCRVFVLNRYTSFNHTH
jgi:hypothetical protein